MAPSQEDINVGTDKTNPIKECGICGDSFKPFQEPCEQDKVCFGCQQFMRDNDKEINDENVRASHERFLADTKKASGGYVSRRRREATAQSSRS